MAVEYRVKAGDVLDDVCQRHYGRTDMLTAVLAANKGLAAMGPVMPAGLLINLPDAPVPVATASVRLWD
jgi:phage tail protein X